MAYNRAKEVFETVKARDAVLLSEVLENMSNSERTSVLSAVDHFSTRWHVLVKRTPLIAAVQNEDLDCVKVLLKYKADVEGLGGYFDEEIQQSCCTPLFCAAAIGNLDILSCLIENGADINESTEYNHTPLMIAIARGHLNVVTFLVKRGANLHIGNDIGQTALLLALCRRGLTMWGIFSPFYMHEQHVVDRCPALMLASETGEVNLATFLIENGANVTVKDDFGATALHYAVCHHQDSLQVLSCLTKNGADVNARTFSDNCTPLMMAAGCGQVDAVTFLIEHGALVDLQDKDGKTALHYAGYNVEVVGCLIKNGGDVNARDNDGRTVLMTQCLNSSKTVATFLIENGAKVDLQDKNGDTALHFALSTSTHDHEFLDKLLALGASHLSNNVGLTPLLQASIDNNHKMVEYLIQRPEITLEQRIDALELLGASRIVRSLEFIYFCDVTVAMQDAFKYIKQGMELRFANPSQPLLKKPVEPVEAYEDRKECQTLVELAQIKGDLKAIIMESLIIRERILGKQNTELLLKQIRAVAFKMHNDKYENLYDPLRSIQLYSHAVEIAQSSHQTAFNDLCKIYQYSLLLGNFQKSNHLKQRDVLVKLLEQTVLEYEKQDRLRRGIDDDSESSKELWKLFHLSVQLLSLIPKFCEEGTISILALLRKLSRRNPRSKDKDTVLHWVIRWCMNDSEIDTVKLVLNAGFNVNAVNRDGDTPLHIAVTFKPSKDKIHVLTDMVELLLDGGAHHDFVNKRGKTPMDMAQTDEARMILSEEKRKLELQCISARAVKKFGIPYLGLVPKILEKYISMH